MLAYRIEDPVFTREIHLLIGDRGEAHRLLTKRYNEKKAKGIITKDAHGMTFTVEWPNPTNPKVQTKVYYIWMTGFDNSPRDIATLAHECFHCVSMMADTLDVPTDEAEGSEFIAHFMGYLIEQSLKFLRGTP